MREKLCKCCNQREPEICFSCYLSEKMEGSSVDRLKGELLNVEALIDDLKRDMEIILVILNKKNGKKK